MSHHVLESSVEVEVAGQTMVALSSRNLFWPSASILFVADLHLGKATSFRSASIPIPRGTNEATLGRLSEALRLTEPKRLVVLGDLWHDKHGRTEEVEQKLCAWRAEWPDLEIALVTGNHDLKTGRPTEICGIAEHESLQVGPFVWRHHPEPDPRGYVLCGHLHPAARLKGRGGQSLSLPCFWFGRSVGVLPAFGEMTGTADIRPEPGDQVLAVVENCVIPVHRPTA